MNLFDLIDKAEFEASENKTCPHTMPPAKSPQFWEKTLTRRPGDVERCTWTCKICGEIRGRA